MCTRSSYDFPTDTCAKMSIIRSAKPTFWIILAFCLITLTTLPITVIGARTETTESVVITFYRTATTTELSSVLASAHAIVTRSFTFLNAVEATVPVSALQALKNNPLIVGVDSSTITAHIDDLAADTQIHADQAWSAGYTGTGVRLAILDTGIDQAHPEFSGRIAACHTEVAGTTDCTDDNGHGTHVAGIAAAQGSSNQAKGVAPAVTLLIDKVCNSAGSCLNADIEAGINWAVANNANVISMSLGGLTANSMQANCDGDISTRTNAINTAISRGISVVAASGNNDAAGNVENPGCISNVIAVGAVDGGGNLAAFSDTGAAMSDHGVVAPGVCIFSTWPHYNSTVEYSNGCTVPTSTYYTWLSGTSMATPMVSGTLALALSKHPSLDPSDMRTLLFSVSDCTHGGCPNNNYCQGTVDAINVINAGVTMSRSCDPTDCSHNRTTVFIYCTFYGGCTPPSRSVSVTLTVNSVGGLSGNVNLYYVPPSGNYGNSLTGPSSIWVPAGGSNTATLTASAWSHLGYWTWTIKAGNSGSFGTVPLTIHYYYCSCN